MIIKIIQTITRELEIVNSVKPTLTFKTTNEINNQNINFIR